MQDYTNYNRWANGRLCEVLNTLTGAQMDEEHPSSFNTLRKTLSHVAGAENIWLQRLTNAPDFKWNSYDNLPTAELCGTWLAQSEALVAYVENTDEATLAGEISFKTMKGLPFTHSRVHCIMHVANHSTFHRGQLITLLRQVGISTIPATDFIFFMREKQN